jgi:feruloyl esterase
LKALYAGPRDSAGNQVFPGLEPGGEDGLGGWGLWITGSSPTTSLIYFFGHGFFSNMVYGQKDWDPKSFAVDDALKAAAKTEAALNATDPDLSPFKARGGKLIVYHGWSDAAIPPQNSINYYNNVTSRMGQGSVDAFMRLYMVPGLQHCGGGPGANSFLGEGGRGLGDPEHDIYAALEQWVEKNVTPTTIIATKYADDNPAHGVKMTRPLCAYPETARYKGTGDMNDAANFVCSKP